MNHLSAQLFITVCVVNDKQDLFTGTVANGIVPCRDLPSIYSYLASTVQNKIAVRQLQYYHHCARVLGTLAKEDVLVGRIELSSYSCLSSVECYSDVQWRF